MTIKIKTSDSISVAAPAEPAPGAPAAVGPAADELCEFHGVGGSYMLVDGKRVRVAGLALTAPAATDSAQADGGGSSAMPAA